MVLLETLNLRIRDWELRDAKLLYPIYSNPEVMRFTTQGVVRSIGDAENWVRMRIEFNEGNKYKIGALVLKENNRLIGRCGLGYLKELDEIELGCVIDDRYWRRGFATEACRGVIEYAFNELNLLRIIAFAHPLNIASIKLMQKSGMKPLTEYTEFHGQRVVFFAIEKPEQNEKKGNE